MSEPLIIAVPSKGRPKEQVDAWLADCGLEIQAGGGSRGYVAALKGAPGVQLRLLSAGDIADALDAGDVHIGATGEDLLRERRDMQAGIVLLKPLGFARADLVVAVPKSWVDVESMFDLEEVAHDYLARTGRRMRVATKYVAQTRAFFAKNGLADYRITESGGATEGAPAAGAAEFIVDITTTGATLTANGLKVLSDGLILRSQFHLAASLRASWSADQLQAAEAFLRVIEARAVAKTSATLIWPADGGASDAIVEALVAAGASRRPSGLLAPAGEASEAATRLTAAGVGPVSVSRPDFVFDTECKPFDVLKRSISDIGVKTGGF